MKKMWLGFLAAGLCWTACSSGLPEGFVLVSDVVPDVIQEIRYYSTYNFVGRRIDGYETPVAILTRQAAEALKRASDDVVRRGYRLKIYDAYRPQRAVDHFVRWSKDPADATMKAPFYPGLEKSELFPRGYIAEKSGHSRGSTVDLTLFDASTGKEVDMGGTFDWFGESSHPAWTNGLTSAQIANRMLLRETMLKAGFKPIEEEWWHFTLKDEPYPDTAFDFPVAGEALECPEEVLRRRAFVRRLEGGGDFDRVVSAGLADADPMIRRYALNALYEKDARRAVAVSRTLLADESVAVRQVAKSMNRKGGLYRENVAKSLDPLYDHDISTVRSVKVANDRFVMEAALPEGQFVELRFGKPKADLHVWLNGVYLGQFDADNETGHEFRLEATKETKAPGENVVEVKDAKGAKVSCRYEVEVLR